MKLLGDYDVDVAYFEKSLGSGRSFDVIKRRLAIGDGELTMFYIDGFVKDAELQRIMQTLIGEDELGDARQVMKRLAYLEVDIKSDVGEIITAVLSGQTAVLAPSFDADALLIDARTYPARSTAEPDSDRVMSGARDGFVETLVANTALIRRRIRDPRLTMQHFSIGEASATDVVHEMIWGNGMETCIIS